MFTENDLKQISEKGISEEMLRGQLEAFGKGFPFLRLSAAAAVGNGIMAPTEEQTGHYIDEWKRYKATRRKIEKFVPASGAASRMFKDLYAFLDAAYDVPTTDFEKRFFDAIGDFAFRDALEAACLHHTGLGIDALLAAGRYKEVVACLLGSEGLNYGHLPKGLLLFHSYPEGARTSMEEHLVEGALYAESGGEVNLHFTVSHEHLALFEAKVAEKVPGYEQRHGVRFHISFSEQKPSTDTVAANADNTPFRNADGSLLFRPGGHGALIENLNERDADIVFIKNIDNVVPDRLKADTTTYKQVLAGILVSLQQRAFSYLRLLDSGCSDDELAAIADFLEKALCCHHPNMAELQEDRAALADYLHRKLNRPMRVCGVVRNVGEPGGGPFLTYNQDGTVSLQILESSQIDASNETYQKMFTEGTHFNPVDLVCAIKDYRDQPFHLPDYVDRSTGFISEKSKDGRVLKALELPGLWNGAMSDWNTVFVEVPLSTFNPVKTVNDLLREEHR